MKTKTYEERVCQNPQCNKPFSIVVRPKPDPTKYCSHKCAGVGRKLQTIKTKYEERTCSSHICNKTYSIKINSRQQYCSRKCADTNRRKPVYKRCANPTCNMEKNTHHVLCPKCTKEGRRGRAQSQYKLSDEMTLEECTKRINSNKYDVVRAEARKKIVNSGKDMKCEICGYNNHVEIAHIKPVSEFTKTTLLAEINSFNNLKILCPNHHWELDNRDKIR